MAQTHSDKATLGEESSPAALADDKKTVLVTVHGTGAGDETASGDRWWQLGSVFLVELGKRLELDPERVEIAPFQWDDGPNSEKDRRAAGRKLYEKLSSYDDSDKDYYLVCHSHGGSVAHSALLQSVADDGPLKGLKCWCTVGTPFLDYRPNRFLFQRLHSLGLVFYVTALLSIILGICAWINLAKYGPEPRLSELRVAFIVYGATCLTGLFLYERWFRKITWFTHKQKQKTASLYASSWYGFWHKEDEAISALANIKNVSAPIIPPKFLQPIVAIGQLLIVAVLGVVLAVDIIFDDAHDLLAFLEPIETSEISAVSQETETSAAPENLQAPEASGIDAYYLFVMFAILSVVLLVSVGLLSLVLMIFSALLGRPLAGILNKVIWSSVRQRAWGDDLLKEDVKAVTAHPPEFADKFGPLPVVIEDPMRQYSSKHAIETLERVREVLGMKPGASASSDLKSELTENLQWKELIHTSYFDVSEFVDLLALTLHRAGLGNLRQQLTAESAHEKLGKWLQAELATE